MVTAIKSPLTTHAFDPTTLPAPSHAHDLVRTLIPNEKQNSFETLGDCQNEDRNRARTLLSCTNSVAQKLGGWLWTATQKKALSLSPASSVYMRYTRRLLLGVVHNAIAPSGGTPDGLIAFTLIHPDWYFSVGELHKADLKRISRQMYGHLRRAGIVEANGILFACVHGEFDGKGYQLHFHGVASGKKAKQVKSLRGRYGYIRTATIQRPVQCSEVDDLPGWLSYCMKSFWPHRPRFTDRNGKERRGKKQRLPAAQHVEVLLWMARQHLFSMTVRSGFSPFSRGTVGTAE